MEATLFPIKNNSIDHLFTNPEADIASCSSTANWYEFYALISLVAFTSIAVGGLYLAVFSSKWIIALVLTAEYFVFELFQNRVYIPLKNVVASNNTQVAFLQKVQGEIQIINSQDFELTARKLGINPDQIDKTQFQHCTPLLARAKVYEAIAQEHLKTINKLFYTPSNLDALEEEPNYRALVTKSKNFNLAYSERLKYTEQVIECNKFWHETENRFLTCRFHAIFCSYIASLSLHKEKIIWPSIVNNLRDNSVALAKKRQNETHFLKQDSCIFSINDKYCTRNQFRFLSLFSLLNMLPEIKQRLTPDSPKIALLDQLSDKINEMRKAGKFDSEIAKSDLNEFDELLLCEELQDLISRGVNISMIELLKSIAAQENSDERKN